MVREAFSKKEKTHYTHPAEKQGMALTNFLKKQEGTGPYCFYIE
jgi:hypothetical protein